jgi:hypothetical protein
VHPGCETCRILTERLQDAINRLDLAVLRMHSLTGAKKPDEFTSALLEVESARMDCQTVRIELERHRAQHQAP